MFDDDDSDEEKPPSLIGAIFGLRGRDALEDGEGEAADDEDEEGGPRVNWPAIGAVLLGVGLIGGLLGYWFMGGRDEEVVINGPRTAAVVSAPMPPKLGSDNPEKSLITPPKGGDVSDSDRSASRRPWLAAGAGGGDGAVPPPATDDRKVPPSQPSAPTNAPGPAAVAADGGQPAQKPPASKPSSDSPPPPEPAAESVPAPDSQGGRIKVAEPAGPQMVPEQDRKIPQFDALPVPPKSEPLTPAPIARLSAKTPQGALPVIGPEGEASWKSYARPFEGDARRARVAIVVTGLGLRRNATEAAIERLPAEITLSFSPYADGLKRWVERARARGHEVLIDMPMEPSNYPVLDPGPYGLLTVLSPQENIERLETALARSTGYIGIVANMGSRFLTMPTHFLPVLMVLAQRGLLYLDNGATGTGTIAGGAPVGLPHAVADITIDERPFASAISARLDALTAKARASKRAIGLASPLPVTFDRITVWVAAMEGKGVTLAPLSAVVPPLPEKK
ncbi:MAG: divergent polysaccharide deacetylase family protein [Alphaproteobacteria bacterium]